MRPEVITEPKKSREFLMVFLPHMDMVGMRSAFAIVMAPRNAAVPAILITQLKHRVGASPAILVAPQGDQNIYNCLGSNSGNSCATHMMDSPEPPHICFLHNDPFRLE